jgi:DNA-binding transcriptional regulator YiaG
MVYLPSRRDTLKADELLKWRTERALTRKELALALGTTQTTVYRWETALREIPPFLHLSLKWLEQERRWTVKARDARKTKTGRKVKK